MKKTLSVILAVLMILSCLSAIAFAENDAQYVTPISRSKIPIITISGDGDPIYTADGERALSFRDLFSDITSSTDKDTLKESVANVLYPFVLQGVCFDNWQPYYDALEKEIGELFEKSILDENGDPRYGTDIRADLREYNDNAQKTDFKDENGTYGFYWVDYYFHYDWRLDPMANADIFHDYIENVRAVTGQDKVAIVSRCLGTSVVAAYISKYGMDHICGVGFDGGTVNGSEFIGEMISGKFKLDLNAINRFINDMEATKGLNVDNFIKVTMDMLDKNGIFETVKGVSKELVYYKLVKGVTSALALSTFFTYPCYWASISAKDYETAKEYVFGPEGSEKRVKYAGLIAKIDNYDVNVRQRLSEIYDEIAENGNISVMAKYGFQMVPTCESMEVVADQFSSVNHVSIGATTSTVYDTLSDKYIAEKEAAGLGKYISPDKQIDASTCQFPDNTWFIKGASHSYWTNQEIRLMATVVTADRQLTVDDFELSQFMVYNYDNAQMSKMTAQNCHCENWVANANYDKPTDPYVKLVNFLKSMFDWFRLLLNKIFK